MPEEINGAQREALAIARYHKENPGMNFDDLPLKAQEALMKAAHTMLVFREGRIDKGSRNG